MSFKAIDSAMRISLPCVEKSVLVALAWRFNDGTSECFPSIPQLCADAGLGRTAVRASLDRLERRGIIRRSTRCSAGGKVLRTDYVLDFKSSQAQELCREGSCGEGSCGEGSCGEGSSDGQSRVATRTVKGRETTLNTEDNTEVNTGIEHLRARACAREEQAATERKKTLAESAPVSQLFSLYEKTLAGILPSIREQTEPRKAALRARWADAVRHNKLTSEADGLKFFDDFFKTVAASDFLAGRKEGVSWRASFDWLMKPANFQKVLDGNYENRGGSRIRTSSGRPLAVTETEEYRQRLQKACVYDPSKPDEPYFS